MTIRSGSRQAEPPRVMHGRSRVQLPAAVAGNAAQPSPERGLPSPIVELKGQVKSLERRVAELEKAVRRGT